MRASGIRIQDEVSRSIGPTHRRRSAGGGDLVDADPVARPRGRLRLPCPEVGHPSRGPGRRPTPSLQERQGRHIRRVVQAVGDLRDGQPARYQRPSHPDGRLCFRRSPTQRDRRAAHRPANDRTLHSCTERNPSPRSPSISVAPRQAAAKRTMSYISREGRVDALRAWMTASKIDKGSCFGQSGAGGRFRGERSTRNRSTPSSNSAP